MLNPRSSESPQRRRQVEVVVRCDNCHEQLRSDVTVYDCEEGCMHPAEGTLHGDWLIRWMMSHRQPNVWVVRCEHL